MNIQIKRTDLLHALAAADGIARPGPVPLLECVLITAAGKDVVTIAATDTAMTIKAEIASTNRKEGSLAMNAKLLRDVVKGAAGETVSLVALDNAWVEIRSGAARYKLAAITGRDFPKIPEPGKGKTATFDSDTIKTLIDRVLFSTSDDKTRMQLNGALFEVSKGVASMTSTDGHRLSRATCTSDAEPFSALIPKEALAKLARIVGGETMFIVEPMRVFIRTAGLVMSSPLITEPPFPNVSSLISAPIKHIVTVDRAAFVASIERTKIATNDVHGTNIDARAGLLVLSSVHPDVGEVSDEIAADNATDKIASCVAPKYLLEPLARMTDETVNIKLGVTEFDPLIIEGTNTGNYLALLMPMRRG
jgi:DNA polymerase-3 subunit beta